MSVGCGAELANVLLVIYECFAVLTEAVYSAVDVDEHFASLLTPTQYELPSQKFSLQSELTTGFHPRNWAGVIPNLIATHGQSSPLRIV